MLSTLVYAEDYCIDSDGGIDYYEAGEVDQSKDGVVRYAKDNCGGNTFLIEQYCDENGDLAWEEFTCENGCYNNRCSSAPTYCHDSDGDDKYTKGTITYDVGIGLGEQENTDTCYSAAALIEYGCDNWHPTTKKVVCQNGCENGVCTEDAQASCSDSDDGKDELVKGICTDAQEFQDTCDGSSRVFEYYCGDNGCATEVISCPVGMICKNGACEEITPPTPDCTDHYEYYCYKGNVYWYDSCGERQGLKETCKNGCRDISCIEESYACLDTDKGLDTTKKGITSFNGYDYEDHCAKGYEESPWSGGKAEQGDVIEYACNDKDGSKLCFSSACRYKVLKCPAGMNCQDGRCQKYISEFDGLCEDRDGFNFYLKGTTAWKPVAGDISFNKQEDYCVNANTVSEGYCDFDDQKPYKRQVYNCQNGCEDGACIKLELNPDFETGPLDLPKEHPEEIMPEYTFVCMGCISKDKCYPIGYRKEETYCSDNEKFLLQGKADSSCNNNFECKSNLCIDDKCIESGFFQKILNWFKNLFG
jgi:hypothetical protein